MTHEEFVELKEVKELFDQLQKIRIQIINAQDAINQLKKRKSGLYEKIGELAEEYEVEPFFKQ